MKTKLFYFFITLFAFSIGSKAQTTCTAGGAFNCISVIGPATPGNDWATDTFLSTVDGNVYTAVDMQFSAGAMKFRANSCWDDACTGTVNPHGWGPLTTADTGWPSGSNTAAVAGGPNIICPGGVWTVTFTLSTQSWVFTPGTPNPIVNLIGTAVPGGSVTMTTTNGVLYIAKNVALTQANCQFQITDPSGTNAYGSTDFPNGTATSPTDFIPVSPASGYDVTFDYTTGDYTFKNATFPKIAIVGAGAGGWPVDPQVDANALTTTDGITYTIDHIALISDAIKFRQDNDWKYNWGGGSFPTGPTVAGDNIAAVGGNYSCTFNLTTGAYAFTLNTIALVGDGAGGWPPSPQPDGYVDPNVMSTTDGLNYTLSGFVLTDGGAKFRENNAWNDGYVWGGVSFPTGPTDGTQNIATLAGTYNVSFNRTTGVYDFADVLAVNKFENTMFSIYPNPTSSNFNIKGDFDTAQVYSMTGQLVKTFKASEGNQYSVSDLTQGIYLVKVTDKDNNLETMRLIKD